MATCFDNPTRTGAPTSINGSAPVPTCCHPTAFADLPSLRSMQDHNRMESLRLRRYHHRLCPRPRPFIRALRCIDLRRRAFNRTPATATRVLASVACIGFRLRAFNRTTYLLLPADCHRRRLGLRSRAFNRTSCYSPMSGVGLECTCLRSRACNRTTSPPVVRMMVPVMPTGAPLAPRHHRRHPAPPARDRPSAGASW